MSPYAEARRNQLRLLFALFAIFLVVAMLLGPLNESQTSFLVSILLVTGIGAFVWCMLALGRLVLRCPHCDAAHHLARMGKPPARCSHCGEELSSWYDSPEGT